MRLHRLVLALLAIVLHCVDGLVCSQNMRTPLLLRLRGAGKAKGDLPRKQGKSGTEPILCKFKKGGCLWELACRPEKVEAFKDGKCTKRDLLVSDAPSLDWKKGEHAPQERIQAAFGTHDLEVVTDEILAKGEFQMTAKERAAQIEIKKAEIINYISLHYEEPKTHLPIPSTRVQNGIDCIKGLKIDPFRAAKSQGEEIATKLKQQFPMIAKDFAAGAVAQSNTKVQNLKDKGKEDRKASGGVKANRSRPMEKGGRQGKRSASCGQE